MAATLTISGRLRYSHWDSLLIAFAAAHATLLLWQPSILLIAIGLWWNANTVAHNFIHRPFFRSNGENAFFSACLSLVLGFPQTLWRDRHLAHHAGRSHHLRWSRHLALESVLVLALWTAIAACAPGFFFSVYLPGYFLGLGLCHLQGHYEHARGTTSHYGTLYNLLFLNDGYHVEHHERPGEHWTRLPHYARHDEFASRWPAVVRWLEVFNLDSLERCVLRSRALQRFVLKTHARAFERLAPQLPEIRQAKIVGGGLFPRTVLVLRAVLPGARLTVVERSTESLAAANAFLPGNVELLHEFYIPGHSENAELLVIPLAFSGDRESIYRHPPATAVLVHDWIWRPRGESRVISWLLLKRLNLVRQ